MMNRHQSYDLKQLQSLPLDIKVDLSKQRIVEWYEHYNGNVFVSFSGGKDSTLLLHLVRSIYPNVKPVYCHTGLEDIGIREFALKQENVEEIKPNKNFRDVILQYGYPVISKETASTIERIRNDKTGKLRETKVYTKGKNKKLGDLSKKWMFLIDAPFKISAQCCNIMKKLPFHRYEKETGTMPYIGTLADESHLRKYSWEQHGCNAFDLAFPQSRPLSFWTEQDVLRYLYENKIEIAKAYGEIIKTDWGYRTTGCERTGCIWCLFGSEHEKPAWKRFKQLKETNPKLYEYCMKSVDDGGLGIQDVITFITDGIKAQWKK